MTSRDAHPGSRVYRAEAVVLKRLSIGETDRVVTLFTRDRGKLSAVAKGARGPRAKLGGVTEPFTYFHGLLAVGQNLDVLTQAEVQNSFADLRKDLTRIGYASYFSELVDSGLEERQPAPELWDLLVGALGALEVALTPDVLGRAFELNALSLLGYEPVLHQCVSDQRPVGGPGTGFHPLRGGLLCPRCASRAPGTVSFSSATLPALHWLAAAPLLHSARSDLAPQVRRELAAALIPFVRGQLDAPLRSLQFLDDVSG